MIGICLFDTQTEDYLRLIGDFGRIKSFYVMKVLHAGCSEVDESIRLKSAINKAIERKTMVEVTDETQLAELLLLGL